jgi:hypothetical protein
VTIKYAQPCQWTSLTTKTIKVYVFPSTLLSGTNDGLGSGKGDGENHPNVQGILTAAFGSRCGLKEKIFVLAVYLE